MSRSATSVFFVHVNAYGEIRPCDATAIMSVSPWTGTKHNARQMSERCDSDSMADERQLQQDQVLRLSCEFRPAGDGQPDRAETRRLVPDEPFPQYSYVTGRYPHPTRDPAGHSFGAVPVSCPPPDPNLWRACRPYLYGLDLFNHGYYWEAHEVWEGIWHACGRAGVTANFMKGLIKLAAAGVKTREGRPEGVRTHARGAAELFRQTAERLPPGQSYYFGLSLPRLIALATDVAQGPAASVRPTGAPVEVVFSFSLWPDESQRCEPEA